jgi:hypothetical protein
MTALVWDQVGERRYETGIDRGVLFLLDGTAVAWNGLTSVTEEVDRETKSYHLDGVKYLERHVPGSFSGKLQAFTYPDQLEQLVGTLEFAPGVFVHDQRSKLFNLSYRTLIGNDSDGIDHGYKLHILYNLMAVRSGMTFDSVGGTLAPKPFEWSLSGTPATMFGIRPTSHISLDSRTIDPLLLVEIEELVYGTAEVDSNLPDLVDLLALVEGTP